MLRSHPERPEASRLLLPAVDGHQRPVFQPGGGGIVGPRVQQQRYGARWRLQAYGEVAPARGADVHPHLGGIKEGSKVCVKRLEAWSQEVGAQRQISHPPGLIFSSI